MEFSRSTCRRARQGDISENCFAIGGDAADTAETDLECLLNFALKLGEKLILCGANIERVSDTIWRICESYHCQEVHFFALDCYLTLSLTGEDGEMASAQRCVRGSASIHLERLCRLNQLSRDICAKPPSPRKLDARLEEASDAQSYSPGTTLFFSLLSSAALTGIYDGSLADLLIILLNMVLINLLGGALARIVFLLVRQCTAESFIYNFFAAMTAAIFAECMAVYTKNPSTVFLYPSIIPLTPGRAFYFSVIGLILDNQELIDTYLTTCTHSLVGMGLGFVVVSCLMYYWRRFIRFRYQKECR